MVADALGVWDAVVQPSRSFGGFKLLEHKEKIKDPGHLNFQVERLSKSLPNAQTTDNNPASMSETQALIAWVQTINKGQHLQAVRCDIRPK